MHNDKTRGNAGYLRKRLGGALVAPLALLAACSQGVVDSDGVAPYEPRPSGVANPGDPSNPSDPGDPGSPGDPGAPSNPGNPGAPTQPGTPSNPGDPGDPGNGAGGTPAVPAAPGVKPTFSCNPSMPSPVGSLRRLTMTEYRNSLNEIVTWATGNTEALDQVAAKLELVPTDKHEVVPEDKHGTYRRLDQSIQQIHVDNLYEAGVALGAALTTEARLGRVVGECATDDDTRNDAACLDDFVRRFGEKVMRRPLEDDEVEDYKAAYGNDTAANAAAYADVIGVMLNAPQFLYFVEHGGDEVAEREGARRVTDFELASRLSYQFWQSPPDEELLAAAADGALTDPDVYSAQVERLISDPRARVVLDEFFHDWVKAQDLPALDQKNDDPVYRAFAADNLPGANLRRAMIDDTLGLLTYYTWQEPANLLSIFTTEKSFAKDPDLAAIYGIDPWSGTGEPPSFSAGQRPGLLTRAMFLVTGSVGTRPIMKGVFIRKQILCDSIPPPPAAAANGPPDLKPGMSTRDVVQEVTEQSGTACAACHVQLINSLGFATENFDALGRYRTEETLFDKEGNVIGTAPLDTSGVPNVVNGDTTRVDGVSDLMPLIADSGKVEACLARNYFRFTFGRMENAADGCALEQLRNQLVNGNVVDLLRAAALTPAFVERTFD